MAIKEGETHDLAFEELLDLGDECVCHCSEGDELVESLSSGNLRVVKVLDQPGKLRRINARCLIFAGINMKIKPTLKQSHLQNGKQPVQSGIIVSGFFSGSFRLSYCHSQHDASSTTMRLANECSRLPAFKLARPDEAHSTCVETSIQPSCQWKCRMNVFILLESIG